MASTATCLYCGASADLEQRLIANAPEDGPRVVCRDAHACLQRWKIVLARQASEAHFVRR